MELGVHKFTWLLFDCQRTFVIDVLAHFSVIDVVALNRYLLKTTSHNLMNIHKHTTPKVLVLTSTFPRFQNDHEPSFVYELCRRLAKSYSITVVSPHAPGAKPHEIMDGIAVWRFKYAPTAMEKLAFNGGITANLKQNPLKFALVPFFVISQLALTLKIIRLKDIDIVHAHWLIPQGLVVVLARFFSKKPFKFVCTSHGGDLYGLRGGFYNWLKKFVMHSVDGLTVVSKAMLEEATRVSGGALKNAQVISMGIDATGAFTPSDTEKAENEILFVGRLVEKKGIRYLLDAMPLILKEFPGVILKIAGDGPEKEGLQKQVKHLNIEQHVHFFGALPQSQLPELYRHATVFVAPSVISESGDQEGLGLVFAEAMACQCAVISSDLPAIADVVINGETGITVRQKDSADLAAKIILLLGNPELRSKLGCTGRTHVLKKFDWGIIADRYRSLLNDISIL